MMQIGSAYFHDYTNTLRRVYWAELVDRQMRERRRHTFRASLVDDPFAPRTAAAPGREACQIPAAMPNWSTAAPDDAGTNAETNADGAVAGLEDLLQLAEA